MFLVVKLRRRDDAAAADHLRQTAANSLEGHVKVIQKIDE